MLLTFECKGYEDSDRAQRASLTYCAEEHEDELNDVRVSHRVETPQQGVDDGDSSRDPDAHCVG